MDVPPVVRPQQSNRLLRSSVMLEGTVHGFSTRLGGVSPAPFAGLNLGFGLGDPDATVEENRRRFQEALEAPDWPLVTVKQVHGRRVVTLRQAPAYSGDLAEEADALVTALPGLLVGVRTADCVPILLAGAKAVGAVHAGWRGTALGVVQEAVKALETLGEPAEQLRAAIGPCIQGRHYPVGLEVVEGLRVALQAVPGGLEQVLLPVRPEDSRPGLPPPVARADLSRANRLLLEAAGVPGASIDLLDECVCCDPAQYFSFRRDAGRTGRMLSVIGLPPAG